MYRRDEAQRVVGQPAHDSRFRTGVGNGKDETEVGDSRRSNPIEPAKDWGAADERSAFLWSVVHEAEHVAVLALACGLAQNLQHTPAVIASADDYDLATHLAPIRKSSTRVAFCSGESASVCRVSSGESGASYGSSMPVNPRI